MIRTREIQELKKCYETQKREKSLSTTIRQILGFPEEINICEYLTESSKHPRVSQYFCENICPIEKCKEKQKISL